MGVVKENEKLELITFSIDTEPFLCYNLPMITITYYSDNSPVLRYNHDDIVGIALPRKGERVTVDYAGYIVKEVKHYFDIDGVVDQNNVWGGVKHEISIDLTRT